MFNNAPFYHAILHKMVMYFGDCFNDLTITRTDSSNNVTQIIKVPIAYEDKNKWLARADVDPEIQKTAAVVFPRMGFIHGMPMYDGERKLPAITRWVAKDNDNANRVLMTYAPVPYNIPFTLHIGVKNVVDGIKIIDQILGFFQPDHTAKVEMIPSLGLEMDIPIVLNSVEYEDEGMLGMYEQQRNLLWTINFTVKTYFFGPIHKPKIIKFADANFYVPNTSEIVSGETDMIGQISVSPGLTANGEPTSNSSDTISANTITITDDFGYITVNAGQILVE